MDAKVKKIKSEIEEAMLQLGIEDLRHRLTTLETLSQQADFWASDPDPSSKMKEISRLDQKTKPWIDLHRDIIDLAALINLDDIKLESELDQNLDQLQNRLIELRKQLMFVGLYDDHGAVVSISAGAGGTDAQDWAQMLLRMYLRFLDRQHWTYKIIDQSMGEEAGIKNAVVEIDRSDFVYGKLKAEHGVHRLVRLSPFNADNLRQTSFAKVEVYPKIESPSEVNIDAKELKIDVYRSGGHGGQSVNTTDSAVRVTHLPTGISIAIQNERSQLQNREMAMIILRSRLAQIMLEQHAQKISDLKGPNQSAEWGNQIRSYVLHPYKQVKDLRTKYETSDVDAVLGGDLERFIEAYLDQNLSF